MAWTKCLIFYRRYFQMHLQRWKLLYFDSLFTDFLKVQLTINQHWFRYSLGAVNQHNIWHLKVTKVSILFLFVTIMRVFFVSLWKCFQLSDITPLFVNAGLSNPLLITSQRLKQKYKQYFLRRRSENNGNNVKKLVYSELQYLWSVSA